MATLITKITEKLKDIEYKKPKYKIKNLYIASIVKLSKREFVTFGVNDNYYKKVKDFALFYKVGYDKYIHIKSGQKLSVIDSAIVGDYCVVNERLFLEEFAAEIREAGFSEKTKFSKHAIDILESDANKDIVNGPIPKHKLFGD